MSIFQIKDYIYICNNLVANPIITNGLGKISTFFEKHIVKNKNDEH